MKKKILRFLELIQPLFAIVSAIIVGWSAQYLALTDVGSYAYPLMLIPMVFILLTSILDSFKIIGD